MQSLIIANDDLVIDLAMLAMPDIVNSDAVGLVDKLKSHRQRGQDQYALVGVSDDVFGDGDLHQRLSKPGIGKNTDTSFAYRLGDDVLLKIKGAFRHPDRIESEVT